jgi:hypothetical protein
MNQMKRYFLLAVSCVCAFSLMKAQEMKTLFIQMPDAYLPQLETAWRKDLTDLYLAGKEARLQNTMNAYSKLLKLTEDYLLLQVTERSSVEIKRLPLVNNTYILCMVTTVEGPAPDSRVTFYTTEWQPLESSGLLAPVTAGWFIKENADREAIARLDIDLIRYRLSPDDQSLTATYTTPLYLHIQERREILPFLKDSSKVYVWNKSSFR